MNSGQVSISTSTDSYQQNWHGFQIALGTHQNEDLSMALEKRIMLFQINLCIFILGIMYSVWRRFECHGIKWRWWNLSR